MADLVASRTRMAPQLYHSSVGACDCVQRQGALVVWIRNLNHNDCQKL
jgi:hypothetical protein